MAWALPRGAQHPIELALMSAAALTALSISLAHEGFHMAFRDELTGLPGRRALNERLQRMGRVYTLAMADVDHFKIFNDTHGHDVGDQVLRMHFLQSPDAGLRHPDLRCDRILLPVQPCPILEITLGYWTIAPVVREVTVRSPSADRHETGVAACRGRIDADGALGQQAFRHVAGAGRQGVGRQAMHRQDGTRPLTAW
ncbi:hypothetical protein G6F65_018792 [Rhizopus arrhizus]|nr:hypothetical protein G6F65_018792 [Rhizopus arrhizus]